MLDLWLVEHREVLLLECLVTLLLDLWLVECLVTLLLVEHRE